MSYLPYIIRQKKIALRKTQKAIRESLDIDTELFSQNLVSLFKDNLVLEQKSIIASYSPINKEFPIKALEDFLIQEGHTLALPVMIGKRKPLIFREYTKDTILLANSIGIPEPHSEAKEVTPSVVLTPLLAFDRNMGRLGYGGGYYDRTIRLLKEQRGSVLMIGIGYAMQEVDSVPIGRFDNFMDAVITEKNVLKSHSLREREY
ncbi:MAG: 5-formyltetrahydrofolate cyclo-ligase [Alphaproteobacteria bacterium]|nr:5-formyltetrahydrofolate cyclo-ligase [Alphaproteobacteria bacterium]MCL2505915.1 5-formyltetrahydrofolate cyclo-ligase [Alphaproteobacteria bacterium]